MPRPTAARPRPRRAPRSTGSTRPPRAGPVRRRRRGARLADQPVRDVGVGRSPAGRHHHRAGRGDGRGRLAVGGVRAAARTARRSTEVGTVDRAGQGRADLLGALRRRRRLRGDVPADRPAVHSGPARPGRADGHRRAEDHRLLGVPAPGRRRAAASASARRRPTRGGSRAPRSPCSTSRDLAKPDPAGPVPRAGRHSEAEFDPHAFLYWPADAAAGACRCRRPQAASGALVLRVDRRRLTERAARCPTPTSADQHDRCVVGGDTLDRLRRRPAGTIRRRRIHRLDPFADPASLRG